MRASHRPRIVIRSDWNDRDVDFLSTKGELAVVRLVSAAGQAEVPLEWLAKNERSGDSLPASFHRVVEVVSVCVHADVRAQ